MTTFAELGLSDAASWMRFAMSATKSRARIQEQTIPSLLQGHDVIGQAQTGNAEVLQAEDPGAGT